MLKQLPCIPLVENLLKDGTDGCALAALIHFYCPDIVKLEGMSNASQLVNMCLHKLKCLYLIYMSRKVIKYYTEEA